MYLNTTVKIPEIKGKIITKKKVGGYTWYLDVTFSPQAYEDFPEVLNNGKQQSF